MYYEPGIFMVRAGPSMSRDVSQRILLSLLVGMVDLSQQSYVMTGCDVIGRIILSPTGEVVHWVPPDYAPVWGVPMSRQAVSLTANNWVRGPTHLTFSATGCSLSPSVRWLRARRFTRFSIGVSYGTCAAGSTQNFAGRIMVAYLRLWPSGRTAVISRVRRCKFMTVW